VPSRLASVPPPLVTSSRAHSSLVVTSSSRSRPSTWSALRSPPRTVSPSTPSHLLALSSSPPLLSALLRLPVFAWSRSPASLLVSSVVSAKSQSKKVLVASTAVSVPFCSSSMSHQRISYYFPPHFLTQSRAQSSLHRHQVCRFREDFRDHLQLHRQV
jgi:hypothetical protein